MVLGLLIKIIGPLLFQGFEIYKNRRDDRVIRSLQKKVKILRIITIGLTLILISMGIWIFSLLRA